MKNLFHILRTPTQRLLYSSYLPTARLLLLSSKTTTTRGGFGTERDSKFTEQVGRWVVSKEVERQRVLTNSLAVTCNSVGVVAIRPFSFISMDDAGIERVVALDETFPQDDDARCFGLTRRKINQEEEKSVVGVFMPRANIMAMFDPMRGEAVRVLRLGVDGPVRSGMGQHLHLVVSKDNVVFVCGPGVLRVVDVNRAIVTSVMSKSSQRLEFHVVDANAGLVLAKNIDDDNYVALLSFDVNGELNHVERLDFLLQGKEGKKDDRTMQWTGMAGVASNRQTFANRLVRLQNDNILSVVASLRDDDSYVAAETGKTNVVVAADASTLVRGMDSGRIEVVDLNRRSVRILNTMGNEPVDYALVSTGGWRPLDERKLFTVETTTSSAVVRAFQIDVEQTLQELDLWRKIRGKIAPQKQEEASMTRPPPVNTPKHGKIDDLEHFGGNQWAGGTGGSDTAGLGGRGGPYRLSKGPWAVRQISETEKAQVDEETARRARELNRGVFQERLAEIGMNDTQFQAYEDARKRVAGFTSELRAALDSAVSKSKERTWIRRASFGELDDNLLVDAMIGERLVYKRRGMQEPTPWSFDAQRPIHLRVAFDVSGSMYRFNSMDARLDRELDAALMMMEALSGVENSNNNKFAVSVVGHSGETPDEVFFEHNSFPTRELEKLRVLETMRAHAQFCMSGDSTVEAMRRAVGAVANELLRSRGTEDENNADGLVVLLSDANLRRYGISAAELGAAMKEREPLVKAHVVFIATLGDEAARLRRELPLGRAHVCLDTGDLPRAFRGVLESLL